MAISMTGYGRGEKTTSTHSITIDIKSVNHRYLECYFKIPKTYSFLEDKLRRGVNQRLSRGKLEIVVAVERYSNETMLVELNKPLVASYLNAVQQLKDDFELPGQIDLHAVLGWSDIFKSTQPLEDQEVLGEIASAALEQALEALLEMRRVEGNGLSADLQSKIGQLEEMRRSIMELAPLVVTSYQERLSKRIQELTGSVEVDPSRLAMEVALFADKSDISEELVRLGSHQQQFLTMLKSGAAVGRKLDFLIQEMNREINTIGSKANELKISQIVIDFKAELEKIREQIQNIE